MIDILFEDESILVCIKPSGTLSEYSESKLSLPRMIAEQSLSPITLYTVHRLDKEVSGVMVYAKSQSAAKVLSDAVSSRQIKKEYLAIVEGVPKEDSGTLVDLLFKDSSKNRSYVVTRERKGVKKASLFYQTLASEDSTSLVKIGLHTGRTHQIRVQFSSRGHSVVGDRKYGSKTKSYSIALCSYRLEFAHPISKKPLSFSHIPNTDPLWQTYQKELSEIS